MQLKKQKTFVLWILIFLVSVSVFWLGVNHSSDTRNRPAQASLTTNELLLQFEEKGRSSLDSYIEKAIEVKGVIQEVTLKEGVYSIILDGDGNNRHILCEMQKNQNIAVQKLHKGDSITIKGIYKGFLMDAILLNCILA